MGLNQPLIFSSLEMEEVDGQDNLKQKSGKGKDSVKWESVMKC